MRFPRTRTDLSKEAAMKGWAAILFISFLAFSCGSSGDSAPVNLVTISLTPDHPSIPVGVSKQIYAFGNYSDGKSTDITSQVTWISSTPEVAAVNSTGLVTAVAPGTTTVTATTSGISGSMPVAVTSASLSALSVFPANDSVAAGATRQLAALATYSDGTTHDITPSVAWSSSDPAVVAVDGNGLATGAAAGTAIITGTRAGISGSAVLAVPSP